MAQAEPHHESAATAIGRVRHVLGSRITAELFRDVAGTTPLFEGRIYHLGQIGSLVRIPHGTLQLLGAVTMIGMAELAGPPPPSFMPEQGDRWIQFQLLGQIDGLGRFQRGVGTYPALDDPVHFATAKELAAIYPPPGGSHVRLGSLSTARGDAVSLDLSKLVVRHSAVVGSTGSGKSSTVARLIQAVVEAGYSRANIVVIDPHGEYSSALAHQALVESVMGPGASLFVPYWALSVEDLLRVFGAGAATTAVKSRVHELVVEARRDFLSKAGWAGPPTEDVTGDTPVPFDVRDVWYKLDFENRATYEKANGQGDVQVTNAGDAQRLHRASFQPYSLGSAAPFRGPQFGMYAPVPDRMRTRLLDPRFAFLRRTWPDPSEPDPLPESIAGWLGGDRPISVLDFSGVAPEAADVAIGVVLSLLFEVAAASTTESGVGRSRPLLIVLEEAHRFLGGKVTASAGLAREAAEQIAREGRKYGVGLMLVSQRPSELSDTVLSQVGSILALRLTNPTDQATVKSALPDVIADLAEALPSLRTGEALITGEAIALPSRVLVDRPVPEPAAADPSIDPWHGEILKNDLNEAVARWRGQDASAV